MVEIIQEAYRAGVRDHTLGKTLQIGLDWGFPGRDIHFSSTLRPIKAVPIPLKSPIPPGLEFIDLIKFLFFFILSMRGRETRSNWYFNPHRSPNR
jgi:hypothetical protein